MTIKKTVALLLAVMLLAASTAFAALPNSGASNSETQRTCNCGGKLTLTNGKSKDYITAKITSGVKGKLSVLAKIYWSNGETTVNRPKSSTSSTPADNLSVTVFADNIYAIRASSSHAYTSPEYGTWYGTVNKNY